MNAPLGEAGPQLEETKRLKQEVDELTALFEITTRLRRPFELSSLLDEILQICRDLTDAEAASLLLVDENGTHLNFILVRGGPERMLMNLPPLPIGEGIAGWVAKTGECLIVNDVSSDTRFSQKVDTRTQFITRSVLAAPLRTDDAILGVLEVINKRGKGQFTAKDQRLFEMMASQAAAAYQHVRAGETRLEADRMATIGRMASAIIHDLKNPMTAIKGFAELIMEKAPDVKRYSEIIVREIDRLVGMTHELLEFSKGVPDLKCEPVSIETFINELIEVLQPDFDAAEIKLVLELNWSGELEIDSDKISRVMFNLSNNARDAMPEGGTFTIRVEEDKAGVAINLSDTGCGMDEQTRLNCFETFFSKGKRNGTGLGLAIVRTIIRAHDGTIELTSEEGKGTQFRIWLPFKQTT